MQPRARRSTPHDPHVQQAAGKIGGKHEVLDRGGRYWFEPHRLPDAGDWRIPDIARIAHLLATRLAERVRRIIDRDNELLIGSPRGERRGRVYREWRVAAGMLEQPLAIDVHRRTPVDGSEVD